MIRRIRLRAGLYLSGLVLFVGVALAAQATQPVTRSEMEAFVYSQLAISALAVLTGGAGILAWILQRDRALQREAQAQIITAISDVAQGLNRAIRALEDHNDSKYAHAAASEHNHEPLVERIDEIDRKVDMILRDCEGRECGARDPMRSERVRRASDPADFDGRPERGRG